MKPWRKTPQSVLFWIAACVDLLCHGGNETKAAHLTLYGLLLLLLFCAGTVSRDKDNNETALRRDDHGFLHGSIHSRFGDRGYESRPWLLMPDLKTVEPQSRSLNARIYNAAITQTTIDLKMIGRADWTVSLPAPDQNFERFAELCSVTRGN
ncbi:MAG: hypothetical protein AAF829_10525 [Pseudomonadota bacterium]